MFPSSPINLTVAFTSQAHQIKFVISGERWLRVFVIPSRLLEVAPSTRQSLPSSHGIPSTRNQSETTPALHTSSNSIRVREVEVSCEELVDRSRLRIHSASWTSSSEPLLVVLFSDNYLRYIAFQIRFLIFLVLYTPERVNSFPVL